MHTMDYVLRNGGTSYPELAEDAPEAAVAAQEAEKEESPEIPILTAINEDQPQDEESGDSTLWRVLKIFYSIN